MFFDNASTTKIDDQIIDSFKKLNDEYYYNPGGLYKKSRNVRSLIDECRVGILKNINGDGKIIFTGSATEANNIAIMGVLKKNTKNILISSIEHPSVYNVALELKNRGYKVDFIKTESNGMVSYDDFKKKMREDTDIISVMCVNNETGAVNNIVDFVNYARSINPNVVFHCDAVQAVGKIDVDVEDLGVDMLTMSAHKIHGCKGCGALYVRNGLMLKPMLFGGGQEYGLRSGTENLLGIWSLGKAIEISVGNLKDNYNYVLALKNEFLKLINGVDYSLHSFENNSPYIVSISFKNCRAETLLNMLSDRGVYVGNGSACSSSKMGNRVLESMGVDRQDIQGNLRISFSKYNTIDEVVKLAKLVKEVVFEYLNKAR